ncbi:hypothetical protein Y032_0006g2979 [Ancylostoma ceylanicum]|uniref:Uncharacterized protein n=1 Tax=Ancylostoma ceylanicum TaxID=53326 RepID=A0A016VRN8_9BILA|nr:hypothetical protein Y032_0006g2979 [Ancylostoma ceylanicum]
MAGADRKRSPAPDSVRIQAAVVQRGERAAGVDQSETTTTVNVGGCGWLAGRLVRRRRFARVELMERW